MPPSRWRYACSTRCGRWTAGLLGCLLVLPALCAVRFTEVAEQAGLRFQHQSGAVGELWTVEITGSGVAILDYDRDGRYDVWLVQGGPLRERGGELPSDQLFRNVSTNGKLRFENVTNAIGLTARAYGMGIATADVDLDGDTDVYLANFGANQIFIFEDGRFKERPDLLPAQNAEWSISASFTDYDADGQLDLYTANYLQFPDFAEYKPCFRYSSRRAYCAPSNFAAQADRLYRGSSDGSFVDVSKEAGIQVTSAPGMGVVARDFNRDGRVDFYIANDAAENFLFLQTPSRQFEELALLSGIAVNGHGRQEASMGITVADFDRDFDLDIFLTHDVKESNTLYEQLERDWYEDMTAARGLAAPSVAYTGFGTGWVDFENDGDLDLYIANGSVSMLEAQLAARVVPPLQQFNQCMVNDGHGRFTIAVACESPLRKEVGRGAAFGDLDNDGDVDVVIANNDGKARVLRNDSTLESGALAHWLGLELVDAVNGHVLGARVTLDDKLGQWLGVHVDGSYASANDPRVVFGLGSDSSNRAARVRWVDGVEETFENLSPDRYHRLERTTR